MVSLKKKNKLPQEQRTFGDSDPESAVALVRTRYWASIKPLTEEMSDYWLNHAFLHGHQWLYYSVEANQLDEIVRDPDRVQATVNRLWPNTRTIVGKLMGRSLTFDVPPSDVSDTHIRGARLAEAVARGIHQDHQWENLREDLYYAVWKGGTAAVSIEWDQDAEVILSDTTPGQSPVKEGDTYEEHLNITQFAIEPGSRYPEKARWWIKAVALPPQEVKAKFHLAEEPAADATAGLTPFQRQLVSTDRGSSDNNPDLTLVLTMYERPNPETPKGRVIVVVGDEAVFDEEWPYPFENRLNLVVVRETPKENRWTGDTVLTMARPLQTLLNVSWSSIAEHMKLAGNARLMVPQSSAGLIDELDDLPGGVLAYNDSSGGRPEYLSPPQMPAWWIEQPARLEIEIDDIMGVHDVSRGKAPPNIESGFGITVLTENDTTPVSRLSKETAGAFGRLMSMALEIYEKETRRTKIERKSIVQIPGQAPLTVVWNGEDFKGQTTALIPEDAILPRSRAAQMEMAKDLMAAGLITTLPEFASVAEMPGQRDVIAVVAPDIDRARRENSNFGHGRQSVPYPWDDHQMHIDEHNKYRKTVDYDLLNEEDQGIIQDHIDAHVALAAEELGRGRAAGAIDPALAMAPNPTGAPMVDPVGTPTVAPGGGGGAQPPPAAPPALPSGAAGAGVDPGAAADQIMESLNQLGTAP